MIKNKRRIASLLIIILCISLNINPITIITIAITQTKFIKDLGVIKDNIIFVMSNKDDIKAEAAETNITTAKEELDIAVNDLYSGFQESEDDYYSDSIDIDGTVTTLESFELQDVIDSGTMGIVEAINLTRDMIIEDNDNNTAKIIDKVDDMQHKYKVSNIYSINNQLKNSLWRPEKADLPYLEAAAFYTVGYAGVYSGYWDLQITDIKKPVTDTFRATEILGYDSLIRYEGYIVDDNKKKGTYIQTMIDRDAVTWSDAVQVLYKALGQYEYTYAYYTSKDSALTPETSPLSQSLSGVTEFDNSEGKYNFFISRSSQYISVDMMSYNDIYWQKALNDGAVINSNQHKNINGLEFIKLASSLMQLYGEPVLNTNEVNMLLQVYGEEYPIQMGNVTADAWAYLKARGCLNIDLDLAGEVSRDDLLDICMCIADPNSRTDYKNIQLTMNLGNSMTDIGYYPVNDISFTDTDFSIVSTIDYTAVDYFDYFIKIDDNKVFNINNKKISTEFKDASGTKRENLFMKIDDDAGDVYSYEGIFTDSDSNKYYHFRVKDTWDKTISVTTLQSKDTPEYIDIPSDMLGGGVYSIFAVNVDKDNSLIAIDNSRKSFDDMKDKAFLPYVDSFRAEKETEEEVSSNRNIFEIIGAAWDKWTTPMVVDAAVKVSANNSKGNYIVTVTCLNATESSDNKDDVHTGFSEKTMASYLASLSRMLNGISETATSIDGDYKCNNTLEYIKTHDIQQFKGVCNTLDAMYHGAPIGSISTNVKKVEEDLRVIYGLSKTSYESLLKNENGKRKFIIALVEKAEVIASLIKVGGVTNVTIEEFGSYSITCTNKEEVLAILKGFTTVVNESGKEIKNLNNVGKETNLNTYVGNSAIMSRDKNILLSWDTLKETGYVIDTFNGSQPMPEVDGTYYIYSNQGLIKVNDDKKTILIGTTFYNLSGKDGKPILVYVDQVTQNVYFDIRCIMGIFTQNVFVQGSTVTMNEAHIGVGKSVVYSIPNNTKKSAIMETISLTSYNYPDTPNSGSNSGFTGGSYTTTYINNTAYDKQEMSVSNAKKKKYWSSAVNKKGNKRMTLASFCPTANWVTVIRQDESETKAMLFVWYPRQAFVEKKNIADHKNYGDASYDMSITDTVKSSLTPYYENLDENGYPTLWYDKMTWEAYAYMNAYAGAYMTTGKYVVRCFDISNNSATVGNAYNKSKPVEFYGNNAGACYWLEGIGFVYNMPSLENYSHMKYLSGEIMLPMVYCSSQYSQKTVLNMNIDYYHSISLADGSTIGGYGKCIGADGVYDAFKLSSSLGYVKPLSALKGYNIGGSTSDEYPYTIDSKGINVVLAPAGIFVNFGGFLTDSITPKNISSYASSKDMMFLGALRIKVDTAKSTAEDLRFFRGSQNLPSFNLSSDNYRFYRVLQMTNFSYFVCIDPAGINWVGDNTIPSVDVMDMYTNDVFSMFKELQLDYLLQNMDNSISIVILVAMYILPIIGIIIMTVLIGLSFVTENKVVQNLFDKTIDPIRILTFGNRSYHNWHWRNSLIPCIIMYCAFALVLNGNLLKILAYLIEWFGIIRKYFMELL